MGCKMDKNNILLSLKAAIVAAAGAFTAAFGWLGWLVVAWVACMALDWISGTMAAGKNKQWNSARARDGAFHKGGMILVVIVAAIADFVLGIILDYLPVQIPFEFTGFILPLVLAWLIVTELGSILENGVAMGAPCPKFLKSILKVVTAKIEKTADLPEE